MQTRLSRVQALADLRAEAKNKAAAAKALRFTEWLTPRVAWLERHVFGEGEDKGSNSLFQRIEDLEHLLRPHPIRFRSASDFEGAVKEVKAMKAVVCSFLERIEALEHRQQAAAASAAVLIDNGYESSTSSCLMVD